ncbi:DUF397 domain-containing protein [Streptomyces syringium]|uniref:DUF397 domain-containing protein n=1 Tax=Streptomyces syringium TaxID=76729 RepID=UPI003D89B2A1
MQDIRADLSNASWRKSTYSDGDESCLEVAEQWRKSTHSAGQEDCLEVADNIPTGIVAVRDSKRPHRPALTFHPTAWQGFVTAVRNGSGYASGASFR